MYTLTYFPMTKGQDFMDSLYSQRKKLVQFSLPCFPLKSNIFTFSGPFEKNEAVTKAICSSCHSIYSYWYLNL